MGGVFMTYELLSKLYYKDPKKFNDELLSRKSSQISVQLGFTIHDHDAFYCNLPEFITYLPKIYKKYSALTSLCAMLPKVAYEFYERKCLIDEIMLTNDIEGIRSTRKEIIDVLDREPCSTKKQRFDGLIHKYVLLLDDDSPYKPALSSCQDLRNIYNEIVLDEIDPINYPDGDLFRKGIAEIVSGTQQVKHIGVFPETKIIDYINKALTVLNREDIPPLFKTAILHYMIGYIHPFYDGNGRLSRFLSSCLLKEEFNTLVALRLSYTIKNRKNDYYKTFDICNNPKNFGDLTPFLIYFSNVVEQSIDSLTEKIHNGIDILHSFSELLSLKFSESDRKKTVDVIYYLLQNRLFSIEPLDKIQLSGLLEVSPSTAHHYILSLVKSGAPIEIEKDGRKFIYKLDIDKLYDYLK